MAFAIGEHGTTLLLACGAALHGLFAVLEMFPLTSTPRLLQGVLKDRKVTLEGGQLELVATIVRNAGIYNVILTGAFVIALCHTSLGFESHSRPLMALHVFVFSAALVAGLVGLSLSRKTAVQATIGGLGLILQFV